LICNLREVGCEDEMWLTPTHNHVCWWAVLLVVLNLHVLLPKSYFSSELDCREIDCDDRSLVSCGSIVVKALCQKVMGSRPDEVNF
jgi:hypothetical protein